MSEDIYLGGLRMEIFDENKDNTLELMEFKIGDNFYGINVAKVREIVQYSEPTPSPDQHPCIEGVLMLRGDAIPIINMSKRLNINETVDKERDLFIITSFNNLVVGLHVHVINGIRKYSWDEINSPDETIITHGNCIITGIVNKENHMLVLLDFEKIVAEINPVTTISLKDVNNSQKTKHPDAPIMIVDDSVMLNNLIRSALNKAGYKNIISKNNGEEALNYINSIKDKQNIKNKVSVIITDIEMPVMDGLTLCKKLKQNVETAIIPIIIFSSIENKTQYLNLEKVGANEQFSKPDIGKLLESVERYVSL